MARIRTTVHELGQACVELIKGAGVCQCSPHDTFSQRDMAEAARHTGEKVNLVVKLLVILILQLECMVLKKNLINPLMSEN